MEHNKQALVNPSARATKNNKTNKTALRKVTLKQMTMNLPGNQTFANILFAEPPSLRVGALMGALIVPDSGLH